MQRGTRPVQVGTIVRGSHQLTGHQPGAQGSPGEDQALGSDAPAAPGFQRRRPQHCRFDQPRPGGSAMTTTNAIQDLTNREYKWGFVTPVEEEKVPKGLNEDIVRLISSKKGEPEFMLEWRFEGGRHLAFLEEGAAEAEGADNKNRPLNSQEDFFFFLPDKKTKPNNHG